MRRLAGYFIVILVLLAVVPAARAGNYQAFTPAFSNSDMHPGSHSNGPVDLNATFDRSLNELVINSPTDAVSFDQLQSVISQFPGADKMQIQFPNQSQWLTSPAELLSMHNQFLSQAISMGLGSNGLSLPQMVFSSLATGNDALSQYIPGGATGLAMIPINNLKGAMSDTLSPVFQAARDQQMAFGSWMPEWLKSAWLAVYNFFVPYYDATASWIQSFF